MSPWRRPVSLSRAGSRRPSQPCPLLPPRLIARAVRANDKGLGIFEAMRVPVSRVAWSFASAVRAALCVAFDEASVSTSGFGVAVIAVVVLPQTASAHAALRSSDPVENAFLQRAPGQITLTFTEPIDSKTSTIRLLDASGKPVAIQAPNVSGISLTAAVPQLPPGIYNVLWANTSKVDGHAISGSFPFTVLKADGSLPDQTNTVTGLSSNSDVRPLADGIAVRALSLLGLAMVVAGAMVTILWREAPAGVRRGLAYSVYGGAAVLAAATALNLVIIHDAYGGVGIKDVVLRTPSGGYWLTRAGLVLLVCVSATFLVDAPRRASFSILAAAAIYLWAFSATSHAAAGAGVVDHVANRMPFGHARGDGRRTVRDAHLVVEVGRALDLPVDRAGGGELERGPGGLAGARGDSRGRVRLRTERVVGARHVGHVLRTSEDHVALALAEGLLRLADALDVRGRLGELRPELVLDEVRDRDRGEDADDDHDDEELDQGEALLLVLHALANTSQHCLSPPGTTTAADFCLDRGSWAGSLGSPLALRPRLAAGVPFLVGGGLVR